MGATANTRSFGAPPARVALGAAAALAAGADEVGIARGEPEWVFEGYEVRQKFIVVMVVAMDFEALDQGPNDVSQNEVKSQYDRGTNVAYSLAG